MQFVEARPGHRFTPRVLIVGAAVAAACSDGSQPSEPASISRTGEVHVSLSMRGTDLAQSYSIFVGGRSVTAPATGTIIVGGLTAGSYLLTLRLPRNCLADGENPRSVTVAAGETTALTVSVTCTAATGSLRVTTVTSGVDLDRSGYTLHVEGYAADGKPALEISPLDANGTRTISGVPDGEETLTLTGIAINCDPRDSARRTVSITASDTLDVAFTVGCNSDTGQLAFVLGVAPGTRHIFVINANGTSSRRLTDVTFSNDEDPAWSPDGTKIAFTTDRDGNREIYVVNADGSNAERLTTEPAADYEPAWSPDGTRIAFVSERAGAPGIFVMKADGTNPLRLTTTSAREVDPAWSPDGRITFASERGVPPDAKFPTPDIYVMNADGSEVTRLMTLGGTHPAWSPDGTQLAYTSSYCQSFSCYPSIVIVPSSGPSSATQFGPGQRAAWAPDGRKIAYGALDCDFYYVDCTPGSVRIVRLDVPDVTLLTGGSSPAWRP